MKVWMLCVLHVVVCAVIYCEAKPINPVDRELRRVKRLEGDNEMAGEGDLGPHETRRSVKSRGAPGAERNVHMERFFGSRRQVRDQLPLRSSRSAREDHDVTARKNERFGIKPGETSSSTDTEDDDISSSASWETEVTPRKTKEKRSLNAEVDPVVRLATALNAIGVIPDEDDTSASGAWDASAAGGNADILRTLDEPNPSAASSEAQENMEEFFASNPLTQDAETISDSGSGADSESSGLEQDMSAIDAMEDELQSQLAEASTNSQGASSESTETLTKSADAPSQLAETSTKSKDAFSQLAEKSAKSVHASSELAETSIKSKDSSSQLAETSVKPKEAADNKRSENEIVRETRALEPSDEDFTEFVRYLRDEPATDSLHSTSEAHSSGDNEEEYMHVTSDGSAQLASATSADDLSGATLVKRFYRDQEMKGTGSPSASASLPSEQSEVKEEGQVNSDPVMADMKEQLATPRVVYKKEIPDHDTSLIEMPAVYSRSDEGHEDDTAGMDSSDGGLDPNEPNIEIHERGIREDGYLGCFEDESPDRDLSYAVSVSELTPTSCRLACKKSRFAYAAVQYGYLCRCGNSYGKYRQLPEKYCSTKCKGDDNQMCGGFYKSSIFTTEGRTAESSKYRGRYRRQDRNCGKEDENSNNSNHNGPDKEDYGVSEPTQGNFFQIENVQPLFTESSGEEQSAYTATPAVTQPSAFSPMAATFTAPETNSLPPLTVSSQRNELPPLATSAFTKPEDKQINRLPPLAVSTFTKPEDKQVNPLPPLATSAFNAPEGTQTSLSSMANSTFTTPEDTQMNLLPPLAVSSFAKPEEKQVNPLPPLATSAFTTPEDKQISSLPPLATSAYTSQETNQESSFLSQANASSILSGNDQPPSSVETPPSPFIATASVVSQRPVELENITAQPLSSLVTSPQGTPAEVPVPASAPVVPVVGGASASVESKPDDESQTLERKFKIPGTKVIDHKGHVSQWMYLHPQHDILVTPTKAVSANDALWVDPGTKVYKGSIKMKQSWTDLLKSKSSAEYQILAGNIEQAFKKLFKSDKKFVKAKVLGFREGFVKHNPATVTKVVARFALTFTKDAKDDQDKVKKFVKENGKLLDMPVYQNSFKIAEFHEEGSNIVDSGGNIRDEIKDMKKTVKKSEVAKRSDVDPFLLEVFSNA